MDTYPPTIQRPALLKLAEALKSRDNALRRDDCGDWAIFGKRGHIYAVPEGFQIFVMGWTANGWNRAKEALDSFTDLANDGDGEGALFMRALPTEHEAELIRHWVGIAKKMEFSEKVLAQKRETALMARQKIGRKPASEGAAATQIPNRA